MKKRILIALIPIVLTILMSWFIIWGIQKDYRPLQEIHNYKYSVIIRQPGVIFYPDHKINAYKINGDCIEFTDLRDNKFYSYCGKSVNYDIREKD